MESVFRLAARRTGLAERAPQSGAAPVSENVLDLYEALGIKRFSLAFILLRRLNLRREIEQNSPVCWMTARPIRSVSSVAPRWIDLGQGVEVKVCDGLQRFSCRCGT